MAITEAALLAHLVTVCETLGFHQAPGEDVSAQPHQMDGVFVARLEPVGGTGGMNFAEEVRAVLVVDISRPVNDDYAAARVACHTDARTLRNAIARDGAEVSGEYATEDGATMQVVQPPGASYLVSRSRIPLNYEATL